LPFTFLSVVVYHPIYAVPGNTSEEGEKHMAVKFLSEDWAREVTSLVRQFEPLTKAIKGQNFAIQQVVTDVPDRGEVKWFARSVDGVPESALGEVENPDATITQTYDIAVALDKQELNPQAAFMQGKIKITGNLMKLLQLQGFISQVGPAMAAIEREY
jgi:putative sterol carrier protein